MAQKKKSKSAKQTEKAADNAQQPQAVAEEIITISSEDFKKLGDKLEQLNSKAAESEEKYLRNMAELENFRKRKEKERLEHLKYANESLIAEIIPIMNNFDLAFSAAEKNPATHNFAIGVEMILKQMQDLFKSYGVTEINPIGGPFDPNFHEAIEHDETDETEGVVVTEVVKKGYKLHERVIQPATVKTAGKEKGPEPEIETEDKP
jgi:molecular chaperone GrpE